MASETSRTKMARLEARVTAQQKALLERGAAYQGRSVSDFVVTVLQQAAEDVIQEHELLRLNRDQSRAFVETLLRESEPDQRLRGAADEYRRNVTSQ